MEVFTKVSEMREYLGKHDKTIGFVPTMGFLHAGHLSLMKKARDECDIVVASIFVNPTQFAPDEDLESYPRDFEKDKGLCESLGVDVIFYPSVEEIYPDGVKPDPKTLPEGDLTKVLCGKSRPTHFLGVTTVVARLFDIVKPRKAYFGQKDYQQYLVIKAMVKKLGLDIEIIPCPIIREADGLAMSSRNTYLTPDEHSQALVLNQSLAEANKLINSGEKDVEKLKNHITEMISSKPAAKIDYVEILDAETLEEVKTIDRKIIIALAVYFGKARLIDNIVI